MEAPPTFGVPIPLPPREALTADSFTAMRIALLEIVERLGDAPIILMIRSISKSAQELVDNRFSTVARATSLCDLIIAAIDPGALLLRNSRDALFAYRVSTSRGATWINPVACIKLLRIHTLVKNASNYVYAPLRDTNNHLQAPVYFSSQEGASRTESCLLIRIPTSMITSKFPCVLDNATISTQAPCEKCRRWVVLNIGAESHVRSFDCYKRRMACLLDGYVIALIGHYTKNRLRVRSILCEVNWFLHRATPSRLEWIEKSIAHNRTLEHLAVYMCMGSITDEDNRAINSWSQLKLWAALQEKLRLEARPEEVVIAIPAGEEPLARTSNLSQTAWGVFGAVNRALYGTGSWLIRGASKMIKILGRRREPSNDGMMTAAVAVNAAIQPAPVNVYAGGHAPVVGYHYDEDDTTV